MVAPGDEPRGRRRVAPAAAVALVVVLVGVLGTAAWVLLRDDAGPGSPRATPSRPAYPDARSTGASGELTARAAGNVNRPGSRITDRRITGRLTIVGDDVVVRNVEVRTSDYYGIVVEGRGVRLENVTVVGTPGRTLAGIVSQDGGTFEATRVDVSGSEDGVRLADDCVLTRSYVHDLAGTGASHFDGVTADGFRGWRIEDNTIINDHPQTGAVWVGDPRHAPSEGVLRGNLLAGGSYTVYAGPGTGRGIRVEDNRFSTRVSARGGRYGPVASWSAAGNTWRGNVWADGPEQGRPVSPEERG